MPSSSWPGSFSQELWPSLALTARLWCYPAGHKQCHRKLTPGKGTLTMMDQGKISMLLYHIWTHTKCEHHSSQKTPNCSLSFKISHYCFFTNCNYASVLFFLLLHNSRTLRELLPLSDNTETRVKPHPVKPSPQSLNTSPYPISSFHPFSTYLVKCHIISHGVFSLLNQQEITQLA